MDSNEIRELIELISRSNFRSFELEREGFRLKLVKGEAPAAPAGPSQKPLPPPPAERRVDMAPAESGQPLPPPTSEVAAQDGLAELHSPIVGTFYRSSSPDGPPFVEVGSRVKKGQTVCIVEAMKVMNEIESEFEGEIVEVAVANGQPVEYGEVLFRLRPMAQDAA